MATADARGAHAVITDFLHGYGLDSLGTWAWQRYKAGDSIRQIMGDMKSQPAYIARFPAMAALAQQGNAISAQDYINYENGLRELIHRYQIPAGMYDTPEKIGNLLTNRVSLAEAKDRMDIAAAASFSAPIEVRNALRDNYGIQGGDLVGYWLDPDRALPLIEQQYKSAQVTGAAYLSNVVTDKATAERLAAQGVDYNQAVQGFGNVKSQEDLTHTLQGGGGVSQDQLIGAQFGNGEAANAVEMEARRRAAQYAGGEGGAAASNTGVSGLRSASR